MEKLDLTKKYKSYFTAKAKPEIVTIQAAQFLSITGKGDPSSQTFADDIQALYSTAYAIKFAYKDQDKDFVVSKLEGLWWFDETQYGGVSIADAPVKILRSEWEYRLLIRMPDFVSDKEVQKAITLKKEIPGTARVNLHHMEEGKVVQMLHTGPFANEPETLAQMAEFMKANSFSRNGLHHEIYLSDFRKTAPDKLRTILREPVK